MAGSVWEALPEVLEWSRGPPGWPGVFGRPSRKVRSPFLRAGCGQEALPKSREALLEFRESLLEGWEGSVGPPGGP